jgi:hypothetical protein
MKKIIFLFCISFTSFAATAQYRDVESAKPETEQEEKKGFQKDRLFTGGGVLLSLSNYNFGIGVSPVLGYSFNKWFDAGIGFGFTYITQREIYQDYNGYEYATGNKIRQTDLAPAIFARAYPFKFLFVQVMAEHNIISQKYIYAGGGPSDKVKYGVTSLLPGIGYCGGREGVGSDFYFISISVDVLKNKNSPYVQRIYNTDAVNILPIIKAGLQISLFQGRK